MQRALLVSNVETESLTAEKYILDSGTQSYVVYYDPANHKMTYGPGGGGSGSLATADIFFNTAPTDHVENTIGLVTDGTTISEMITSYPQLEDLLSAMLDIRPAAILSASSVGLLFNFSPLDFLATSVPTISVSMQMDRGLWIPTATTGGSIPYGIVSTAACTNPFNNNAITLTIGSNSGRYVNITGTVTVPYTTVLTIWTFSGGACTTAQGDAAYNATNVLAQEPQTNWTTGNTITVRNYLPVYLNNYGANNRTGGPSGQAATANVFLNTASAVIVNFGGNDVIWVPKVPTAFGAYESVFTHNFVTQKKGTVWNYSTSTRIINGFFTVTYYSVYYLSSGVGTNDILITF